MTFVERYKQESTWHGKVIVIELFHLAMSQRDKTWTLTKTAEAFNVSTGLVSENLRLADAIHLYPSFFQIPTRQEALNKLNGRRYEQH